MHEEILLIINEALLLLLLIPFFYIAFETIVSHLVAIHAIPNNTFEALNESVFENDLHQR